jgi:GT2 family glycosyltransferase
MACASPHVTVVLLNWNGWKDTLACLDSLLLQDYPNASIVVVDNASTNDSRERILEWTGGNGSRRAVEVGHASSPEPLPRLDAHDVVYIQSPVNGGFAAGNNLGIRLAVARGADYVWILNNDTEVEASALSALVRCAEADPTIGMCGSLLVYHDARDQLQSVGGTHFKYWRATGHPLGGGLDPRQPGLEKVLREPLSYIAGASLLARATMIAEVGPFEERYFLYFEEIDWAARARRWRLAVALDSIVYHKEGGSIGTSTRNRRSPLAQYYLHRNLLLFYSRFHKLKLPVAIWRVVREWWHQVGQKDDQLARVTRRALLDGVRMRVGPVDRELLQ